jgi:hypothetical protein
MGLLILALLLAVVYAYWYATNDRRVRRLATAYLSDLTGGVVRVEGADFNLFGAVELKGVSVSVPGDTSPEPFFRAPTVLLRHRPWALFVRGHLVPTEIVCMEPVVTLEHDVRTDTLNVSRLFAAARRPDGTVPGGELATIRFRQGRLGRIERHGRLRHALEPTLVEMSMVPLDETTYRVRFEQRLKGSQQSTQGVLELDVTTGEVRVVSGVLPLPTLEKALPLKYAQLRARYNIGGEVRLSGRQRVGPDAKRVRAELCDVSLQLPEEEGGLKIAHVNGTLVFDLDRDIVELENVTGRLPQAGGATVTINGEYAGYETDSPFHVELQLRNLTLPAVEEVTGALRDTLADVYRTYSPEGPMALDVTVARSEGGEPQVAGTVCPDGMSIKLESLPYRLEGLRGAVVFGGGEVRLEELRAEHGKATVELNGTIRGGLSGGRYDITGEVRDVTLDEEFRRALPQRFDRVWQELNPEGKASVEFRLLKSRPDASGQVRAKLLLDGDCAVTYRGFPYPLKRLYGQVRLVDDSVEIDSVRARNGPASCTIDGRIDRLHSGKAEVALDIQVASLPLDETLLAALNPRARSVLESLHATGRAETVSARVTKSGGNPLEYDILVRVRGVDFRADLFPYPVEQADGVIAIRRERVIVESLTGRQGETDIELSGQMLLDRDPAVLDVVVFAETLPLDERLRAALPASVRAVWSDLSPTGTADVRLSVRTEAEEVLGGVDYRLELTPRDMHVRYAEFPYPFRAIEGTVVATPGRIVLQDVLGKDAEASTYLDGAITTAGGVHRAELTVRARRARISEALLASVPEGLAPLAGRFQPGGTCDVDLHALQFETRPRPTASAPASGPATAPATAPAKQPPALWHAEGWIAFDGAVMDLGFGHKTVSGKVTGTGGRTADGLELDAQVALDRVLVGQREITEVTGHLIKAAGNSRMRVNELLARAYGGRLYGLAELQLSDPLEYALSLSVEGVNLEGLVEAGRKPAEGEPEEPGIAGNLAGKLEYRATAGRPDSQQAAGRLRISDGKLYRLPVPLELLYVVTLTLPGEAAFTEGDLQYELHGQELTFREIHLRGPALSVVGSGQMHMGTERLRLNFLAGPPGKVPRIAAELEEVLKPIARELAEIRISGTLSNPGEPRTVTFGSLQDAINRLLNPDREETP